MCERLNTKTTSFRVELKEKKDLCPKGFEREYQTFLTQGDLVASRSWEKVSEIYIKQTRGVLIVVEPERKFQTEGSSYNIYIGE